MRIGILSSDDVAAGALAEVVRCDAANEVIWRAAEGAQAAVRCRRHPPDVVLVDMSNSGPEGIEVVARIMRDAPCAILLLTTTDPCHPGDVFRAIGLGAVDAVSLPVLRAGGEKSGATELLEKLDIVARLAGVGRRAPAAGDPQSHPESPLVVIGASSGGPGALADVLSGLPADFEWPVVVIQHIDARFATGLAEWLGDFTPLPVRVIESGSRPRTGEVSLARTNDHLILGAGGRFEYTREPAELAYRPSIDVFFTSVAARGGPVGVAALLTGIGRDGAAGMLTLRGLGWHTIAQDRSSSVVFGMPRVAAEMGAAVEVLDLGRIASAIVRRVALAGEKSA